MIKQVYELVPSKSLVLELAGGTGSISVAISKKVRNVLCTDISESMLKVAKKKSKHLKNISFATENIYNISQPDNSFDVVTSGYMLRNVTDIQRTIDEMYRVLKPGGRAVVAELSKPNNRVIRFFYELYMKHRVYWLGRRYDKGKQIGGKYSAYEWLSSSVEGFPKGKEMTEKFQKAGFSESAYFVKSMGAVNIYLGIKK
jgi:demethylmenaquinone methyltransferase/2-methoxy-6-polyprenyl-1,4-benzoquinol methylase